LLIKLALAVETASGVSQHVATMKRESDAMGQVVEGEECFHCGQELRVVLVSFTPAVPFSGSAQS